MSDEAGKPMTRNDLDKGYSQMDTHAPIAPSAHPLEAFNFDLGPHVPPGVPDWDARARAFGEDAAADWLSLIWPVAGDIATAHDLIRFHGRESLAVRNALDAERKSIMRGSGPDSTARATHKARHDEIIKAMHEAQNRDAQAVPGFVEWYHAPAREVEAEEWTRAERDKADAAEMADAAAEGDFSHLAELAWLFAERRRTGDYGLDTAPGLLQPITTLEDAMRRAFGERADDLIPLAEQRLVREREANRRAAQIRRADAWFDREADAAGEAQGRLDELCDHYAAWLAKLEAGEVLVFEEPDLAPAPASTGTGAPAFPRHCLDVGGPIGEMCEWLNSTSIISQPELALGSVPIKGIHSTQRI
jgi:hypothetical protein